MRKNLIRPDRGRPDPSPDGWLDLGAIATVEVTSEHPDRPVEGALLPGSHPGWRAGEAGPQVIRLLFDEPQRLRRISLAFDEPSAQRTQEFVLGWSDDGGRSFREIVRQQWNFSPGGATRQEEDYEVDLSGVEALELRIQPDIQDAAAVASLSTLRVA